MHQEFLLLNFLLSYLLHSSVLLACATVAHKLGWLKQRTMAERVWRVALFGALLTASWQVAWTKHSVAHEPAVTIATAPSEFKPTMPPIKDMQSDRTISLPEARLPVAMISTDAPTDSTIRLPASFRFYAEALSLAWCALAVFVLAGISMSMFYLNRKIALMPELEDQELLQFAASRMPVGRAIRIHHGDAWSSPLLCPNGRIFLPDWALEELDKTQCKAMLAHEIAHLLRHDRYWRLAHQIMLRLFFFQIFNRYAVKQLELLAEFDCDQAALEHSNPESFTQTLMQCAQMHINNHPTFALPMAKPSSLLQRINSILSEANYGNKASKHKHLWTQTALTSFAFLSLCYTMPTIAYTWEEMRLDDSKPAPFASFSDRSRMTPPQMKVSLESPSASDTPQQTAHLTEATIQPDTTPRTTIPAESATTSKLATNTGEKLARIEPDSDEENQLALVKTAITLKDYTRALSIANVLAQKGNTEAQTILGEMLWYGDGTDSDPRAAQNWLQLAANKGHPRAQQFIALFTERERRQNEIRYYTHEFDGKELKWTENTCPIPFIDLYTNSVKIFKKTIDGINSNISCTINYIEQIKQRIIQNKTIPSGLLNIMREEEIEKARQTISTKYLQFGENAKSNINNLLDQYERWYQMNASVEMSIDAQLSQHLKSRNSQEFQELRRPFLQEIHNAPNEQKKTQPEEK